jgi:hypothetical protein
LRSGGQLLEMITSLAAGGGAASGARVSGGASRAGAHACSRLRQP